MVQAGMGEGIMPRRTNGHKPDDIDKADIYDDNVHWWDLESKKKPKLDDQYGPPKKPTFYLSPNHVICLSGFQWRLLPYHVDPFQRQGFVVLTTPSGFPVARIHGDLKKNEVSWVLR